MLSAVLLLAATGCSVFGVESVEEATYQLVKKERQFEIRDYEPLIVAETSITANYRDAGSQAFRKLFAYISGENTASEKIAMTAPVVAESKQDSTGEKIAMTAPVTSRKEEGAWRYSFVLPNTYTLSSAPRPLDSEVSLAQIASRRLATVRYSGRSTEVARLKNTEALINWIRSQGLEALSEPFWAGYNAPWTLPLFRRNEVLIEVPNQ